LKQIKNEKNMGLELKRVLEPFFPKNKNKIIIHPFPVCFLCCCFTLDAQRTFVTLHSACLMTQKITQFGQETRKHWKLSDDK
jgi:hypothetical protein